MQRSALVKVELRTSHDWIDSRYINLTLRLDTRPDKEDLTNQRDAKKRAKEDGGGDDTKRYWDIILRPEGSYKLSNSKAKRIKSLSQRGMVEIVIGWPESCRVAMNFSMPSSTFPVAGSPPRIYFARWKTLRSYFLYQVLAGQAQFVAQFPWIGRVSILHTGK